MKSNPDHCLEEHEMLRYLSGTASAEEQRKVELHITDCELCSDALEGLRLSPSGSRKLNALRHELNKKLHPKAAPALYPNWLQIAAVFIILALAAGSYFYITNFTEGLETLSEKREAEKVPSNDPVTSINPPNETESKISDVESEEQQSNQQKPAQFNKPAIETEVNEPEDQEAFSHAETEDAIVTPAPNVPAAGQVILEESKTADAAYEKSTSVNSAEPAQQPVATAPVIVEKIQQEPLGKKYYHQKKYKDAIRELSDDPSGAERSYLLAMSYAAMNNDSAALHHFDEVLRMEKNPFTVPAKIHKARLHIKRGEKNEAVQLLQEIKAPPSARKEAKHLLDSIR